MEAASIVAPTRSFAGPDSSWTSTPETLERWPFTLAIIRKPPAWKPPAWKLYEGSRAQIQGAIDALVKRAIKSGDIRNDLDPFDLLRSLIGVSNVASTPDWQQSARRLEDILISG